MTLPSRQKARRDPPGADEYSVVLFRSSFGEGFQVVVTSAVLDALARTADARAIRQDQREVPQRAIAQQKKDAEDARLSQENTRARTGPRSGHNGPIALVTHDPPGFTWS